MSLFGHERVFASIELDRIALVKLAGNGKDGPAAEQIVETQFDPERPDDALGRACAVLADPVWSGTRRHVVLSDRLVRYLVIERPQGVRSIDELSLAIEARFEQAFDASAADWEIAVDARPLARRFVACGVPRRMLDATRSAFSTGGECASIRPYLVCELDRLSRRLPSDCWFATAARDCVTLIGVASAECQTIRVLPVGSTMPRAITEAIEREQLLAGDIDGNGRILVSGLLDVESDAGRLTRLDAAGWRAQPASWSQGFRVALAEVWA